MGQRKRKGKVLNCRQTCLCCLLWAGAAFGQTFGNRLHELRTGDEIVYDFQQSITAVTVLATSSTTIRLQVATATKDTAERLGFSSWLYWIRSGCPEASTDEIVELQIGDCPSILSDNAKEAEWLVTLLGLASTQVPERSRRRAGPTPMPEELDLRKPWQPRIIVDGSNVGETSDAYILHWPIDTSSLSDRTIVAYVPRSERAVPALPYWVESSASSAHIGVLDSHRAARS
jgi:hypothetical protein